MAISLLWYLPVQLNHQFHLLNHVRCLKTRFWIRIQDYVKTAKLAKKAGYDGVEIMGSEGYLLNQFLSRHVNQRN